MAHADRRARCREPHRRSPQPSRAAPAGAVRPVPATLTLTVPGRIGAVLVARDVPRGGAPLRAHVRGVAAGGMRGRRDGRGRAARQVDAPALLGYDRAVQRPRRLAPFAVPRRWPGDAADGLGHGMHGGRSGARPALAAGICGAGRSPRPRPRLVHVRDARTRGVHRSAAVSELAVTVIGGWGGTSGIPAGRLGGAGARIRATLPTSAGTVYDSTWHPTHET